MNSFQNLPGNLLFSLPSLGTFGRLTGFAGRMPRRHQRLSRLDLGSLAAEGYATDAAAAGGRLRWAVVNCGFTTENGGGNGNGR